MRDRLKKAGAIMQGDSPRLKKTCKTGRRSSSGIQKRITKRLEKV